MNAAGPGVSVVIAVRDGELFLAEALDSVVGQSSPPAEIVVVDGGSRDRSAEIARSYEQVSLLKQEGRGLAGAWNQGIAAAEGELIAFLDSDDRWLPSKLALQTKLLARKPGLAGAIGRVRFFLEPGFAPPSGLRPDLLEGDHVAPMPGALLVRRNVFAEVGDFDSSFEIALDVDWFARLKDAGGALEAVPEVVIEKRVHDTNLSHSQAGRYEREMVRALRATSARQR